MKIWRHETLEEILVKWLRQARSSGISVDSAIVKKRLTSRRYALELKISEHRTVGWIDLKSVTESCRATHMGKVLQ